MKDNRNKNKKNQDKRFWAKLISSLDDTLKKQAKCNCCCNCKNKKKSD